MAEIVYTGRKPSKKAKEKQAMNDLTLNDFKLMFTWGHISRTMSDVKKGKAGLLRFGVNPTTFTHTPEYLFIASKMYLKHPELMSGRVWQNAKKIAKTFGNDFIDTIYMP